MLQKIGPIGKDKFRGELLSHPPLHIFDASSHGHRGTSQESRPLPICKLEEQKFEKVMISAPKKGKYSLTCSCQLVKQTLVKVHLSGISFLLLGQNFYLAIV